MLVIAVFCAWIPIVSAQGSAQEGSLGDAVSGQRNLATLLFHGLRHFTYRQFPVDHVRMQLDERDLEQYKDRVRQHMATRRGLPMPIVSQEDLPKSLDEAISKQTMKDVTFQAHLEKLVAEPPPYSSWKSTKYEVIVEIVQNSTHPSRRTPICQAKPVILRPIDSKYDEEEERDEALHDHYFVSSPSLIIDLSELSGMDPIKARIARTRYDERMAEIGMEDPLDLEKIDREMLQEFIKDLRSE